MSGAASDWREHDGTGCPLPVGTRVEARYRSGATHVGVIDRAAFTTTFVVVGGRPYVSSWCWAVNHRPQRWEALDVVAYRVIDRFREQRTALFRSFLNVPAPEVEPA